MTKPDDDAERVRRELREYWDRIAASRQGAPPPERSRVSECLCEMAEIKAGSHVLDVAAGDGEPALTAARIVGAAGRVVATDQSAGMLAVARQRAKMLGLCNTEFVVTDAEALDVGRSNFDAALCRWGLMFVPNVHASLERIRQLLRPGRWFATAIWSEPPEVPCMGLEETAARKLMGRLPYTIGSFRLDIVSLQGGLGAAGFSDIHSSRLNVASQFESPEAFVAWRLGGAWLCKLMAGASAGVREQMITAIKDGARRYTAADGVVIMDNECVCVAARS